MKKTNILLSTVLAISLSFGFASCSSSNDDIDSSSNNNQVTDVNVVADDASAIPIVTDV